MCFRACRRRRFFPASLCRKELSFSASGIFPAANPSPFLQAELGERRSVTPQLTGVGAALKKDCPFSAKTTWRTAQSIRLKCNCHSCRCCHQGFPLRPSRSAPVRFEDLIAVGEALGRVLAANPEALLLTTSDLNHYEDDSTTRLKDRKSHRPNSRAESARPLRRLQKRRYFRCAALVRRWQCSPRFVHSLQRKPKLVRYATSADISGDTSRVVGYAGFIFS